MEAAGLAVGAVALSGLFNNAVDCFEYIQIGRSFGKNFQTSQIRLDVARLRLSRWGQSLGLGATQVDGQTLHESPLPSAGIEIAEKVLGQIEYLFMEAKAVSKLYEEHGHENKSLAPYNTIQDLEPAASSLHQKMRELSLERQGCTGLKKKIKWALYEEKHLLRLVEDITVLVQNLEDLFPNHQATQRALCEAEVSEVDNQQSLDLLKKIAASQDSFLKDAIEKAAPPQGGSTYNATVSGDNNTGVQAGQNMGTVNIYRLGP